MDKFFNAEKIEIIWKSNYRQCVYPAQKIADDDLLYNDKELDKRFDYSSCKKQKRPFWLEVAKSDEKGTTEKKENFVTFWTPIGWDTDARDCANFWRQGAIGLSFAQTINDQLMPESISSGGQKNDIVS